MVKLGLRPFTAAGMPRHFLPVSLILSGLVAAHMRESEIVN